MGLFTVAEEAGCSGAKRLALGGRIPKKAHIVAIETSRELPTARIGDGVVIRVGDSRSIFSPAMTRFMEHVAGPLRRHSPDFRVQRKLMDGGSCEGSVYHAFGYTCGAACVPLGNYHNRDYRRKRIAAEYVSVDDLVNMVRLFAGMVATCRASCARGRRDMPRSAGSSARGCSAECEEDAMATPRRREALKAFVNSEERLAVEVPRALERRAKAGLEGLVGSLTAIVVNVESDRQRDALAEILRRTGMALVGVYRGPLYVTCLLRTPDSADILLRSRNRPDNPFRAFNDRPRSRHVPNTRLETLVFETPDVERYAAIQRGQGVAFVTDAPIRTSAYSFIQTAPSAHTGTSTAFIQWHGTPGNYAALEVEQLDWQMKKPALAHLAKVGRIDHVALRVGAEHRDPAILELVGLTNYNFDTAIYVESLNSITNVTRHGSKDPAVVFTSGIHPFAGDMDAEPTEAFVFNYGPRTHHVAFWTEDIEDTFAAIKRDGQEFLIDLVGSPDEGLKQTFTKPSPHTLLVHEYIYRYGTFSGFFTKSNVTALTRATANQ